LTIRAAEEEEKKASPSAPSSAREGREDHLLYVRTLSLLLIDEKKRTYIKPLLMGEEEMSRTVKVTRTPCLAALERKKEKGKDGVGNRKGFETWPSLGNVAGTKKREGKVFLAVR